MLNKDVRSQVVEVVDLFEGGLSDHAADRGHLTKYGITLQTLQRVRPLSTAADLRALTKDAAIDLLTEEYAVKPGYARIPDPLLRFVVIDFAIHSGPVTATKALQRAVGVKDDGVIGKVTEAAIARTDSDGLVAKLHGQRLRHLGRLITRDPKQAAFAHGWMSRVATLVERGV